MTNQFLILITGLPGTGKTTFALALAKQLNIAHFNSDIIRADLGMMGRYDSITKSKVYLELIKQLKSELNKGNSAIVDATFYKNFLRTPFQNLGKEYDIPIIWIETKADEQTIKERMEQQRLYTESDYSVYRRIKKEYEPLKPAHLNLWSDRLSIPDMIKKTMNYLVFFTKIMPYEPA